MAKPETTNTAPKFEETVKPEAPVVAEAPKVETAKAPAKAKSFKDEHGQTITDY